MKRTVVTRYRRYYPTFYIKAEGEVDVAYIEQDRFRPVEVKWTGQVRPKDLKQIAKYSDGRILTQSRQFGHILGVPTVPLPLALIRLAVTTPWQRNRYTVPGITCFYMMSMWKDLKGLDRSWTGFNSEPMEGLCQGVTEESFEQPLILMLFF